MQEKFVIIVAGGVGSRINSDVPKQFIEISGVAIIIKTIRVFLKYDTRINIIISIHPDYKNHLEELLVKHCLNSETIKITLGGATRFQSVKNGLHLIENDNAIVAIHDAARPFVSIKTIKNCFDTAKEKGNAAPCIFINDSIRKIEADVNYSIDREQFRSIQTPQCFLVSKIKKAFRQTYQPLFTDDVTVLEYDGEKINLVEGNVENIKITRPLDLLIAKIFIDNE